MWGWASAGGTGWPTPTPSERYLLLFNYLGVQMELVANLKLPRVELDGDMYRLVVMVDDRGYFHGAYANGQDIEDSHVLEQGTERVDDAVMAIIRKLLSDHNHLLKAGDEVRRANAVRQQHGLSAH